ncbi:protoporphyrinogen oxidase [Neodiprion lecontei]|uniref:Protoporphyrinogen oxidase n=1 Tax=Neodiprion lecontei TaxID=441921 RepID=A0A6J0B9V6_NEOLC|nr:protoporphyrinogen oxidase [Neodiprion lecontei]
MSGRTAVLGGGISGLSAAYYLCDNPAFRAIKIIEASSRTGGWLRSRVSSEGVIFEEGPRTIRPRGPAGLNTLNLVDSLKLSEKIIPISFTHPAAKNRMIYAGKKLHTLPNSLIAMFKVNSPFSRPLVSCLITDLKAPQLIKQDESLYSFVERRLGKDAADYLISPMVCGICAGDAKQISVNFLMKSLFEYEQKYGSIVKGYVKSNWEAFRSKSNKTDSQKSNDNDEITSYRRAENEKWSIWTLRGGLEQLPTALADSLSSHGVQISLNSKCEELTFTEGGVELKFNGKTEKYSRVISSLSAKNLAPMIHHQHPQLANELIAIPSVTVAVVNLEFVGNVLEQEAFGFLVPPNEKLPILGVIFDSCILSPRNSTVLTVMMGGAWFTKNFGDQPSKEHLLEVAVHHVKTILHIEADPVAHNVAILKDCIPQYVVGHEQRIRGIENYLVKHKLPLFLCGSSYYGVGLNDVVLSAKQAASAVTQQC